LWRGAFIASIWCAFALAIKLGAEWSTLQHYFNEVTTTQDPQALLQRMTEIQQASGFNISAFALGILEEILRPLLGIAFVIVWVVGFVVRGDTQMYDDPTADIRRYWQESGDRYIAVQYVVLLAAVLLFLPYAVALTEHSGHATELARRGVPGA
jgi:hypothetical protein